ncbi:MAG: ATP-binding protein [Caulobacteraceae bacterium]
MKRGLSSTPVFLQVLGLVLAGVLAAQALNFAVVVFAPDPPPEGFTIAEAARALRGEAVKLKSGGTLRARTVTQPPPFRPSLHAPLESVIGGALAGDLNLPRDAVRVNVRPPDRMMFEKRVQVHAMHASGEAHRQVMLQVFEKRRGEGVMVMRHDGMGLPSDTLLFPPFAAAVYQRDGSWRVVEPPHRLFSAWQHRLLLTFLLASVLLTPPAYVLARRLTRPIHAFAAAAERLGADPAAPPLEPKGPAEVRTAIAAFNDMQEKLRGYIEGRTAMLAAIAHDLRTPLTRLRFHAESSPRATRDKINADIAEMDAMIASVLAFVRTGRGRESWAPVDLGSLASAAAEDFAELGKPVTAAVQEGVQITGDALALKRLVSNLIDNALKFAGAAEVSLAIEGGAAVLAVEDRGPGLPDAELERAFEPFHRLESSRNRETGGVGLGLATARAIAREHGGDVALSNRDGGGLRAEARLPLT